MTKNAISTVEEVDELYWPRGFSNSGSDRVFHVTRECRYVDFTDKPIATTTVGNRPRGRLCKHCTPNDVTIDDLDAHHRQPDVATDGGHPTTETTTIPDETHVSVSNGSASGTHRLVDASLVGAVSEDYRVQITAVDTSGRATTDSEVHQAGS